MKIRNLTKKIVTAAAVFFLSLAVCFGDFSPVPRGALEIELLMERAMGSGLIAGGVVLIGKDRDILYERAFGKVSGAPGAAPVALDNVFDVASLTKVLATTPSVVRLAEEGKLSLVDPVAKWFPEFAGKGKEEVLIVNLLTHTSGLDDFPLSATDPLRSAVEGAASQKLKGEPGHRFNYADINFILLGELVRRATGERLDRFAAETFYGPLGMSNTCFNPGAGVVEHCAATLGATNQPVFGKVQDYSARLLDGVAGHAGLFTTARELSVFCRMLLNEGTLNGRRVLQERTVRQMTVPYFSRDGKVARGLGWDIASPYSSPRGHGFSDSSYGHTGYSGTSVWIDPQSRTYVIFLSSRLDYRHTKAFNQLRSDLSSLASIMTSSEGASGDLAKAPEAASFR